MGNGRHQRVRQPHVQTIQGRTFLGKFGLGPRNRSSGGGRSSGRRGRGRGRGRRRRRRGKERVVRNVHRKKKGWSLPRAPFSGVHLRTKRRRRRPFECFFQTAAFS